ncbi:hypothetical protein [Haloferula sargassicola]|uniref:hypothetical protein n=1 Tax=Haloferula sargassicola TaxID=490096 RepID=UPI0033654A3F
MPARKRAAKSAKKNSAPHLGFEAKLWLTADKLRNNMNAAERSGATWTTIGSPKGWRGGANQFYAPSCVVRLLVEMLANFTPLRQGCPFEVLKRLNNLFSPSGNELPTSQAFVPRNPIRFRVGYGGAVPQGGGRGKKGRPQPGG